MFKSDAKPFVPKSMLDKMTQGSTGQPNVNNDKKAKRSKKKKKSAPEQKKSNKKSWTKLVITDVVSEKESSSDQAVDVASKKQKYVPDPNYVPRSQRVSAPVEHKPISVETLEFSLDCHVQHPPLTANSQTVRLVDKFIETSKMKGDLIFVSEYRNYDFGYTPRCHYNVLYTSKNAHDYTDYNFPSQETADAHEFCHFVLFRDCQTDEAYLEMDEVSISAEFIEAWIDFLAKIAVQFDLSYSVLRIPCEIFTEFSAKYPKDISGAEKMNNEMVVIVRHELDLC